MDSRKKVKLTIETTIIDINYLEDLYDTIPLCTKHSHPTVSLSEKELFGLRFECKECDKKYQRQRQALGRVEGKLFKEWWELKEKRGKNDG